MTPPTGERLARVEEKVDGLAGSMQQFRSEVLARIDALASHSDVERVQAEVDEVKASRRWVIATYLPVLIAIAALAVSVVKVG